MRQTKIVDRICPPKGPYSHAVVCRTLGSLIFVSGLGPFDELGSLVSDSIRGQVHAIFDNLEMIALECGSSLDNLVKTTVYLTNITEASEVNAVYIERLASPYPARTTIGCTLPGIRVEIDAILEPDVA